MKNWTVYYMTPEGDSCKVTSQGTTREEAEASALREYWDIAEIVQTIEQ
jgi:hypothetical protein